MPEQNPKDPEVPPNTKRKKTHFTRLSTTQLLQTLDKIAGPGAEDEKKRRVMVYTQREKNIRRDAARREKKRVTRERRERKERKERKKRGKFGGGEDALGGNLTNSRSKSATNTNANTHQQVQNRSKPSGEQSRDEEFECQ